MKAYYVYCVNCETHIESNGRRVYSTLEKALDFIREHVLSWCNDEDVNENPAFLSWEINCVGGKYIWGIDEIEIL